MLLEFTPLGFSFSEVFQLGAGGADPWEATQYRQLTTDYVSTFQVSNTSSKQEPPKQEPLEQKFLKVEPEALRLLTATAMHDIAHLLRPGHLQQLRNILDDSEASSNDRFVAMELLKNANIAAGGIFPGCQDTGTAIVKAKKGQHVFCDFDDREPITQGIFDTYQNSNLRYSQLAPTDMFTETNTRTNLPAEIKIEATRGDEYRLMFIAKGGGSANKSFLFQQTRALLNPDSLLDFLDEELRKIGTAACPPYHLAVVIGGTSAEQTLEVAKLASTKYLDSLPTTGDATGRAFRDTDWEQRILELTQEFGIGAQFGGKYFCHDVRVIRLARHGASCPVGIAVSCSADRQALGKITSEGVFLEQLESDPARFLPPAEEGDLSEDSIGIDLNRPMSEIRAELSRYPVKTRLSLSGTMVVARDIAHAKIKERLDRGEVMPSYLCDHPVYYAGPAKTPEGHASGSFGPTTAGRMDSYVEQFQAAGGSFVMLAKGNRSRQVVDACARHGGFYLGSVGGPGASTGKDAIRDVQVLEYPELGMEAVWRIQVEGFPAFVVIDDKGNDFFADVSTPVRLRAR